MQFLRRSLVGLFLLSLTAALLGLAAQSVWSAVQARIAAPQRPPVARERVFSVNVVIPQPGTITPVLTTFGEVRSSRTLDLRAPAGGRVVELGPGVEDGATVAEGQLLFRLDPTDATAARDIAAADLARAEADLRDAGRLLDLARDELAAAEAQAALRSQALERQRSLTERGVGSEAAVETAALALSSAVQAVLSRRQALAQAESRRDQAETALARQRIALAEAERRLADTAVHAEFAGILSDVTLVRGGIVTANERVARIIDPEALEVSFRLSTTQYARLLDPAGALIPAEVEIALDVLGLEIATRGTLARVSGTVGEGQTGRLVYARIDAPRGFRPGDFVAVRVAEPALDGVALLPATAVDSLDQVLVVGADQRLEVARVEVLRRQGDEVIVRGAEIMGREVVAARAPMLGAGIRVRPIRPAPAAAAGPAEPAAAEAGLIALDPERRARLVGFIEGNTRMPPAVRDRILAQLAQEMVPAQVVERIESQMGS
jgi:multidrug efflux pump subunit AcrA (membrane-fusion protein)